MKKAILTILRILAAFLAVGFFILGAVLIKLGAGCAGFFSILATCLLGWWVILPFLQEPT